MGTASDGGGHPGVWDVYQQPGERLLRLRHDARNPGHPVLPRRTLVDTMGGRRFKVVERGTKDGYSTATVEFLKDNLPEESDLEALQSLHDQTQATALSWFNNHNQQMKEGILSHYGAMPAVEKNYWRLPSGPAWAWWVLAILPLDTQAQQQVLSQVQLKKRLEAISRILGFIMRRSSNV